MLKISPIFSFQFPQIKYIILQPTRFPKQIHIVNYLNHLKTLRGSFESLLAENGGANDRLRKENHEVRSVLEIPWVRATLFADWKANRDRPKRKREVGLGSGSRGQLSPIFLIVLPVIEKLLSSPSLSISPIFFLPSFQPNCTNTFYPIHLHFLFSTSSFLYPLSSILTEKRIRG